MRFGLWANLQERNKTVTNPGSKNPWLRSDLRLERDGGLVIETEVPLVRNGCLSGIQWRMNPFMLNTHVGVRASEKVFEHGWTPRVLYSFEK
jgi:hypothetical protein